jgi:hypothetical protein
MFQSFVISARAVIQMKENFREIVAAPLSQGK